VGTFFLRGLGLRKLPMVASVLALAVILVVGCGADRARTHGSSNEGSYGRDGYLGMQNSMPNLPTQPFYDRYARDADLMASVLSRLPYVRSSTVWIEGSIVRVRLRTQPLSAEQTERLRSDVERLLKEQVPRYRYLVEIGQN